MKAMLWRVAYGVLKRHHLHNRQEIPDQLEEWEERCSKFRAEFTQFCFDISLGARECEFENEQLSLPIEGTLNTVLHPSDVTHGQLARAQE